MSITVVREQLSSGVVLIRLGGESERVVTLTADRLRALGAILDEIPRSRPRGVVITGPSPDMFTVGADINIIRGVTDPAVGAALAREGQEIFNKIEQLGCPTVAAINGPCIGGGCELALACTYRVISDTASSQIGLPEVKLGILPGFGGTQRLPRLIGLPRALDVILQGKILRPQDALRMGLVDEVVQADQLLTRAEKIARGESTPVRRPLSLKEKLATNTAVGRLLVSYVTRKQVAKTTRGNYPAPPAALAVTVAGLGLPLANGLAREAEELGKLIVTPESKALVRVFLMTEASKSIGKGAKKAVEELRGLVVGAGVMGAGIAGVLAKSGVGVILKDQQEGALARAMDRIRTYVGKLRGVTESERSFIMNRVESSTQYPSTTGQVGLAIEAIIESFDAKRKLFQELAGQLASDAILGTNTSSIPITQIAEGVPHPERVVGIHFFNPVEKMPLVEIIRGKETSDRVIAVVAALTTKMGKYPIVVNDVPGFLVNRILSPYLAEAAQLLSEGYSAHQIDFVMREFGMPMGPIRLLDEIGLDVAVHVSEILEHAYGDRMKGPGFAAALVKLGRLGKKAGKGFYHYDRDGKEQEWGGLQGALGITAPSKRDRDVVLERLLFALILEAVRCLDEGVAGAPGKDAANQIDLGMVMGTGFPPFRGGLIAYASSLGVEKVHQRATALAAQYGARFAVPAGVTARKERGQQSFDE